MAISSTSSSFGIGSGAPSASDSLAVDAKSLNALKFQAGKNDPKAIKESAKQFESMFMKELMKSMREATMKSGMNDSEGEKLGTDMLDQQFAVAMSGQPGGLSELIEKQLTAQSGLKGGTLPPSTISLGALSGARRASADTEPVKTGSAQGDFVQKMGDAAATVSQESGIPASFMLGQAGHETGWGRHLIKNKDGSSANNLFGVKAGGDWQGKVAEVTTTEYINGQPRKVTAKFRAYDSPEDSFRDYAKLINESPRYANARQKTDSAHAYATELKRAGYATDPAYASKLSRAIASANHWQQRVTVAQAHAS